MSDLADNLRGKFIVLDGPDGSGKSTQLALLAEHVGKCGVEVCCVRDPGGTDIGDRIRDILLDNAHGEMTVECELMLYMASRAQLAAEVIRPALSSGRCVLSDRYISATVAYQGAGGLSGKTVRSAGRIAVGHTWPDLTIILDIPADVGLTRAAQAGEHDRMESKAARFHQAVRESFLEQARLSPGSFAVVDATGSIEQVHQRLLGVLNGWDFAAPGGNER